MRGFCVGELVVPQSIPLNLFAKIASVVGGRNANASLSSVHGRPW